MSIQLREYQQQAVDKAVAFLTDSEIWKDITGYEGLYQVSNLGRVKSLDRHRKGKRGAMTFVKGRILSLTKGKHGYIQASLHKDNKQYAPLVHRLVGAAFIPNERNLSCIDHIDSNRANNCVENLRWCTTKENMNFDMVRKNISTSRKPVKNVFIILKRCTMLVGSQLLSFLQMEW